MPQLNADKAAAVDKAEGGTFEPIPEGLYILTLAKEVEVKDGTKAPYWRWIFKVAEGVEEQAEYKGRMLWQNTSLAEGAEWKLNETFAAFGVPSTTHTDELIGRQVKAFVVQKTIDEGKRKGELSNDIKELYPLNASTAAPGAAGTTPSAAPADAVPLY
jgi:hypothetical protein